MYKILTFLLLSAFTLCSTQNIESEITQALKAFRVIPDVIVDDIPETLQVAFNSGAIVDKGNLIYPTQSKDQPLVDWNADVNAFYTIICIDPDAPFPENPFLGELVTWMVGNIPGKNIGAGQVFAEYLGSAPPRGADFNRYIFLVFKQLQYIQFDLTPIDRFTVNGRANFSTRNFAAQYQLGSPVAANFYRSLYDDYVLELYGQLQCCFEYNAPA